MYVTSDVTGKTYESKEATFYRNVVQSAWMLHEHSDCVLLDLFTDSQGKLVFVFPTEQHKMWIKDWANRPHDTNNDKDTKDA